MSELILVNAQETLKNAKTVAIIGCSANKYRTSNYAANYLKERGYRIIPVNPMESEILGETCYPELNSIPEDISIDIVNVFRDKQHTAGVVEEVERWKAKTGQNPVVWTQLDVSSYEAEQAAESGQIPYVRNSCIMVELDKIN